MVHKIQGPSVRQGPLSSLRELPSGRRANAIETRVIGMTKNDAYIMVHDLSDRREAHNR